MRSDQTLEWQQQFFMEFDQESDRASVILAAIMLENALTMLLKTRLAPTGSTNDPLFDGSTAPIGTFSAKINLAYRIGLIPASFTRELDLIRRIRNDFAHNIPGAKFDSPSVMQRISEILASQGFSKASTPEEVRKVLPEGPRGDFQMVVSWMLMSLTSMTVSPIEPADPKDWRYPGDTKENRSEK
jgi:DNA-binding MltR family transcriptional regulator